MESLLIYLHVLIFLHVLAYMAIGTVIVVYYVVVLEEKKPKAHLLEYVTFWLFWPVHLILGFILYIFIKNKKS